MCQFCQMLSEAEVVVQRNPFWHPVKDHIAKCFLMTRAEGESVLSAPNVSQGLHIAQS